MSETEKDHFYSRLPSNNIRLSDLFTEDHLFYDVPDSWHVIITDIESSTSAVLNDLHQTVNLIATGSIVCVLNLAFKANITVPFFFGGDGATFIVPSVVRDAAMSSLLLHQKNTLASFDLMLRVGTVPVAEIYAKGHVLKISKFKSSETFSIPVILGDGLIYAERVIKDEAYTFAGSAAGDIELDLSGMQCRWDRIEPPENNFEVVTLVAISGSGFKQSAVFKKIIQHIDTIYGAPKERQPISVSKLQLKTTFLKLGHEVRARLGKIGILDLFYTWITTVFGRLYFLTGKGKVYLNKLVDMSDTLVIDGRINTVITGTAGQRLRLEKAFIKMERSGEIRYGLHVSKESIMSCYVRDLEDSHIHFVDGAEGGYTKAAGILKQKLAPGPNA